MVDFQIEMLLKLDSSIVFTLWIPRSDQVIAVNRDNLYLELWIDKTNLEHSLADYPVDKHINIFVNSIHARIRGSVSDELRDHISRRAYADTEQSLKEHNSEEYEKLGRDCYNFINYFLERFIDYIYSVKGQYWLRSPRKDDLNPGQFFAQNDARIQFGDSPRYYFNPDRAITIIGSFDEDSSYVSEKDWSEIDNFVRSRNRSPLVKHLLSRARELASRDYRRTAIIESVSALEIALNEFASSYESSNIQGDLANRLKDASVKSLIEKLGLRNTFSIGLPLLLSEEQISSDILSACREAIEQRNNLIHNNQRDVGKDAMERWLSNVEQCCERFGQLGHTRK